MTATAGPKYQRLMDQIRSWITSGKYPVGSPIPSTAGLARATGISVPVVRRAVAQLQADGVLEGHQGDRVYVKALPADAARERQDIEALRGEADALQGQVSDLRETAGRLEANLIDLYLKLGYEYPQGRARDGQAKASRRGRPGR